LPAWILTDFDQVLPSPSFLWDDTTVVFFLGYELLFSSLLKRCPLKNQKKKKRTHV